MVIGKLIILIAGFCDNVNIGIEIAKDHSDNKNTD
jgi:hypothetical protein